jgi:hypothetical protein
MKKHQILDLMTQADRMRTLVRRYPKTVVCLFDNPSPALWSFQAAAHKLGCQVLTLPEDEADSALSYGDVVVMNPDSSQNQDSDRLAELYALVKELHVRSIDLDSSERETLHVTFLGHSRSVQPFLQLLNHFPKIECHFVTREEIDPEVLANTDVFYVSKPQEGDVECLDKAFLDKTKHTSIVMRTLPAESITSVRYNPRCIYGRQDAYGVYLRMAILEQSLSKSSFPTLYEAYWMAIDALSEKAVHYISKAWSMFSFRPLVSTGV